MSHHETHVQFRAGRQRAAKVNGFVLELLIN